MINNESHEVFKSLQKRDKKKLEKLMKCSEFFLTYLHLLHYKYYKVNPNCGGSYINSPDCIKIKKATINSINTKDNKWCQ